MKTDAQLCQDVGNELRRDARLQPNEIGIWVKDGVVILTGYADFTFYALPFTPYVLSL